jgi:hypothetical protein
MKIWKRLVFYLFNFFCIGKGEGTLVSRLECRLSSDYVHMKIGYKKGGGTLLSRCEADNPAIMYTDKDWIQKRERGHYYQGVK